jgi:hypothetical protein
MENKIAIIKNNVVDNVILATTEFGDTLSDITVDVTSIECGIGWSYDGLNFIKPIETSEQLKMWRDNELQSTDYIVPLTDHPDHAATITYRQELRDWPSTDAFPDTKPTKA